MTKVVSIKFKTDGRAYFFDPDTFTLSVGMQVIVETARGIECGVVSEGIRSVSEDQIVKPLKKVIRIATDADKRRVSENQKKASEAFTVCEKKILEHNLDMIKTADYIIDLGPEGGDKGGEVVACGTPEKVAKCKKCISIFIIPSP